MGQFFTAFGVDWRLLLINVINFGILLAGLYYFLYGPLLRVLEERRKKVVQGVEDAEAATARLKEIEAKKDSMLAEAGKEADEVLTRARLSATEKGREMLAQSEAAAASLLKEAEAQAKAAKAEAIEESKQEVAKLIVLGMEKAMTK
jgi:F-type H+-transporting ATPase subunit b